MTINIFSRKDKIVTFGLTAGLLSLNLWQIKIIIAIFRTLCIKSYLIKEDKDVWFIFGSTCPNFS